MLSALQIPEVAGFAVGLVAGLLIWMLLGCF